MTVDVSQTTMTGRLLRPWLRGGGVSTAFAATLLVIIVLTAVFADVLAPIDPLLQDPSSRRMSPSPAHWLGTDPLGRDLLSRLIFGARATLLGSTLAVAISASVGILVGLIAGYFGKLIESMILALTEILQAFPGFLLAIIVVAVMGPSLINAAIAVGIAGIPSFIRLVRGSVLAMKGQDYVQAAIGMGARRVTVMGKYILPNISAPVLVLITLNLGSAVLTVAGLSFLGLGAQPPTPEWGVMVRDGREYLADLPYLTFWPGLAVIILVVSLNMLGDSLEKRINRKRNAYAG